MAPEPVERKLTAILSADVVGYSRLMAEDEAETVRRLTAYRTEITNLVGEHRGRVVDFIGDNFLAEFPTATDAVEAAAEIQRVIKARNAAVPEGRALEFRMGVHLGEVRVEGERIYGDGVNIAARLEGLAEPGGTCISATVLEQIRRKLELDFDDLGEQAVKNIPDPVHAYLLRERAAEAPARAKAAPGKRPRRLLTALVVTTSIFLLLGLGVWASWPRPLGLLIDLAGVSGPPVDPALPDKPSIVVLPFANMSADPEQEYFSDGITEDLTTALAGNQLLFVISRNSAFTYKGQAVKVEDVGRELGVRYVLEGSVRKSGDRVRITAQLVDATTGGHLWSQRYDRDLSDIFALQSEMAEEILGAVGVEIGAAEARRLARKPTESLTAIDAMWKGSFHLNRVTRKDTEEARRLFERSIELDPAFAFAHAILGLTYAQEFGNGWSSDPSQLDRAEELGRRAIELDPSEGAGHNTIAWVNIMRGNSAEAITAAERAIERAPNLEFSHAARGLALAQQARFLEATGSIRQALRLNPRAPTALLLNVAFVNYGAGREEEAVEMWERVRLASPDLIVARIPLAAHFEREGQHDRASAVVEEILRVRADFTVQKAIDLLPGVERAVGSERFAQYRDNLRKAGLPEE